MTPSGAGRTTLSSVDATPSPAAATAGVGFEDASSQYSTSTDTDLSLFLQPSFDASAYVSTLLRDVDASTPGSAPQPPTAPLKSQLHPQSTPTAKDTHTARQSSISLSLSATPVRVQDGSDGSDLTSDPSARKREQAQEDLDVSLAISRLNLAIEELDRSISTQINSSAPELLRRTSNLASMQSGVGNAREGIRSLDAEVANLRAKVHDPFTRAQVLQENLRVYDSAGELVARTAKVVGLARRLETQMEALFSRKEHKGEVEGDGEDAVVGQVHGRDLSRAALLIAEITSLLNVERKTDDESDACSLLDLELIQDLVPTIDSARKTVVDYMEDMIVRGLRDLSPLMLGSSLQTAFNLGTLPALVRDLLNDLTEVVKERTAAAFDLDSLSRQLNSPIPSLENNPTYSAYRSGRRPNPAEGEKQKQQQLWSDALWKRLESLIVVEMGAVCSKVYLLEKVLKLKSDAETGVNFLTAALEVLGDRPSRTFWLTLAQSVQQQVTNASGRSAWLAQTISAGGGKAAQGYPRLLRLFHEFFAKISVYTDVQYTSTHQSAEMVILLRSLSALEKAYVDQSTYRISEALSQVTIGNRRSGWNGEEEGEGVVRLIANALDTTRFDPLLSRAVVDRCIAMVDQFASRLDGVVSKDGSAWTVAAEGNVTPAQVLNTSLLRFTYTLAEGLTSVAGEQDAIKPTTTATLTTTNSTSYATTHLVSSAAKLVSSTHTTILQPLLSHLKSTLAASMAKMHLELNPSVHTASKGKLERGGVSIDSTSGASLYASEVCDCLWYLHERLLPLYPIEVRVGIAGIVARYTVELFLLHASIISLPTGEGEGEGDRIKLRLATDMTELEFSLTQLTGGSPKIARKGGWIEQEAGVIGEGDMFRVMKTFRRMLFLSLDEVEKGIRQGTLGMPVIVMLLHVVARQNGMVERVVGETSSKKGWAAKSEFVDRVLREVLQTGNEKTVCERVRASIDKDMDACMVDILHLLSPSS